MDIRFTASQSVEMAVANQPVPIQHYLRQPQRLIHSLAASSQIEQLGDELFRLKMRPLSFMMLSLQPTVDLRVWAEPDGTVNLRSVGCEIRGIQYINQRFALNLVGQLQPCQVNGTTHLKGRADLEVKVELPPALVLTPKPLLETTGNGLLKSVLLTIKQRLMHHLLADYRKWADSERDGGIAGQSAVLSPNSPIA
ncbi:DUF1997 domain-containing protein [Kovacikia minuta CCNUW1]|uniref:DUF1997 domain-containing protein n=1 Tax=Kovacikia minuta TaxID=2931930 RepID=UPI001CCD71D1|nr:DUF1997 domain-containing protein [Kovacikia minuta]UBF26291.1 DUF1997 domain-containing protein [Kovacikia minuta CCNUW1]